MEGKVKVIKSTTLKPKTEFILVSVDPEEDLMTDGGIIVPPQAQPNKKTQTGTIVAVGPGLIDRTRMKDQDSTYDQDYPRIPVEVNVGERVLFAAFIGYPIFIDGSPHVIIKHLDIMSDLEEEVEWVDPPSDEEED